MECHNVVWHKAKIKKTLKRGYSWINNLITEWKTILEATTSETVTFKTIYQFNYTLLTKACKV